MLVPLGGQTVTLGKGRLAIGWVEMVEETGESDQTLYDPEIKKPAEMKLAHMIVVHATFPSFDSTLLMWESPWMVEVSKNSLTVSMLWPFKLD